MSETNPAVGVGRALRSANQKFDAAISDLNPDAPPPPTAAEAFGGYLRSINNAINEMVRQVNKGWSEFEKH